MIVIGIDPSSTSTGYGLIDTDQRQIRYLDCGCIRPPAHTSFEDRLVFLYDTLSELIKVKQPDEAAVESTFFGKDAVAAFKLGQARGVLLLALRQAGLPISNYTPATVKKSDRGKWTGHQRSSALYDCANAAVKGSAQATRCVGRIGDQLMPYPSG